MIRISDPEMISMDGHFLNALFLGVQPNYKLPKRWGPLWAKKQYSFWY